MGSNNLRSALSENRHENKILKVRGKPSYWKCPRMFRTKVFCETSFFDLNSVK